MKQITPGQLEKIRLILSTYQDGTGQLSRPNNKTLPGWRDFERAVALALNGIAQESKAIYDVLVPLSDNPEMYYGISCKMREMLQAISHTRRATIEVSNSAGKFWNALNAEGINEYNEATAAKAGQVLVELVKSWHDKVGVSHGGNIDLLNSFYLVLQWDEKTETYQLYQYPLALPNPSTLFWSVNSKRLIGQDDKGIIIEWYGHSGGQLKYYPFVDKATWASNVFQLEPLPANSDGYGMLRKVIEYYPHLWKRACHIS